MRSIIKSGLGYWHPAVACTVLVTFLAQLVAVPLARATEEPKVEPLDYRKAEHVPVERVDQLERQDDTQPSHRVGSKDAIDARKMRDLAEQDLSVRSLPSGGKVETKGGQLSLPQGAGKLRGMGESFSAELSTGIATYTVPFELPAARGAAQPQLGLSYSSSGGHGVAGVGWGVGVPSISRQLDRGIPRYDDPLEGGPWAPSQDRFVFGSAELVPICLVQGATCAATLPAGEVMPSWASGWQYFRPRIEGRFQRVFWSPNHRTWRVQDKAGTSMEFGVPLDDSNELGGVEFDVANPGHIFNWHLVRQYDAQGNANPGANEVPTPNNPIIYKYVSLDGISYLSDIYDTSLASNPTATPLASFAHRTHLDYEARPDVTTSYRRGWSVRTSRRLKHVDITSHNFNGDSANRELVRRYHLSYDQAAHVSLLTNVQVEGRCESPIAEGDIASGTSCPRLPAMSFEYQHVAPYSIDGQPQAADLLGFEGFDDRVQRYSASPGHSIDETLTELLDINGDALPDVLVTAPGLYGGKHGLFLNGQGGHRDQFGEALNMCVQGVLAEDANVLKLSNLNVSSHDLDGDGLVNLLHMPMVKRYSVYSPALLPSGDWCWQGRAIDTATQQSPTIDFSHRSEELRTMDVNADGLVDVVYSSGTEYQTYLALGRYPNGDGQFGDANWTGGTSADVKLDPLASCIPWSGAPIRFSDPDVRIADMNGDGFPDVVRARPGEVRYWPGRGNGYWGTGNPRACPAGTFAQDQDVAMSESPQFGIVGGDALLMNDVNGDGLSDLVRIHHQAVSIYLNVDGISWTPRHLISNSPPNGTIANRVRLTDINGSGTPDLLWGDGFAYKYIDLAGGKRPWVMTKVSNGLGRTTEFEYSTSVEQMLAAQAVPGQAWSSTSPMVVHVVSRITDRDNLELVGRPAGRYVMEYTYRDPVYDGRQREFRGFRRVRAKRIGDSNSPTSISESTFLLGECLNEVGRSESCAPANRWRDNPKEALKGLPVLTETFDESGTTYLSTDHTTYRLRTLYVGLDGREVRQAFASASDTYRYDTAPFAPGGSSISLVDCELEHDNGTVEAALQRLVSVRGGAGWARIHSETKVDRFGNPSEQAAFGNLGTDEVITKYTVTARPAAAGEGEPSGWLFRKTHEWVQGSAPPSEHRNEVKHHYFINGTLESSESLLAGTLQLDRFHETGSREVAPPPPTAAADGWNTTVTYQYDDFGNVTSEEEPGGATRRMDYDGPYSELLTLESVGAGALAPYFPQYELIKEASYDRGLRAPTTLVQDYWAVSTVRYDSFGRPLEVRKPDPDTYGASSVPALRIEYFLPSDATSAPFARVRMQTQDGVSATTEAFSEAWSYVDGLGRTIVTLEEADTGAGDLGSWVATGFADYDAKGASSRSYLSFFYSGDPSTFPLAEPVATPSTRARYDAFGRAAQSFGLDGAMTVRTAYHALSADAWDAADLEPGPHAGTPTTTRSDGHGRSVSVISRIHHGSQLETHETQTRYLPTGEPLTITRSGGGLDPVVRWFGYDSLGHMVLNVEPNTTKNFNANPGTEPNTMKAWRYAYDIHGKLVGTSDPRGCGANYQYLVDGRLAGEDYSPCLNTHPMYSPANFFSGDGAEVFNQYDLADADGASIPDFVFPTSPLNPRGPLWGKLVSTSDRGHKTIFRYDGRGRVTGIAKRMAKPGEPLAAVTDRYAPHWYVQTTTYDGADRPTVQSTGADVPELLGTNDASQVTTTYSNRGTVKRVGSSYSGIIDDGTLVGTVVRDGDGLIQQLTYGDVARTSTQFQYDQRRRISSVQTDRGPPSLWSATPPAYTPSPSPGGPPTTFQLVLEDSSFGYDVADNPIEMRDWRSPLDWPDGAKPVTKKAVYDDFYRLTRLDYQYTDGDDDWTSPFAAENVPGASGPKPSPHGSFAKRVLSQSMAFDALGNTVATDDDAHGFYDRSLGTISNGTATSGPYQLKAAANAPSSSHPGSLDSIYDDAGNLVSLATGHGGACLPAGASCKQRFVYDWDEAGRLSRARRWDLPILGSASDAIPASAPDAELRYAYDGDNNRTLKTAVDQLGNQLHTVYVFASVELRRATWTVDGDYERTSSTETAYLLAHGVRLARLHYAGDDVPTLSSGRLHILFSLSDHLGSSSFVIDGTTSELVEATRHLPYGGTESDYRPARWASYRNDYRFTGKEEDIEVGLTYFGQRYLSAHLNRWVSADPLSLHNPVRGDLNVYAYVEGRVLIVVDPIGLEGWLSSTLGPASPVGQWIAHTNNPVVAWTQKVENLQAAQAAAAAVTIVAVTYVTGGLAGRLVVGAGGSAAAGATATSVVGGATYRAGVTVAKGGSAADAGRAAVDPEAVAADVFHSASAPPGALSARAGAPRTSAATAPGTRPATPGAVPIPTSQKTYQTYTKYNPKTGETYTGRTSGTKSARDNIDARDKDHHMNEKGFEPAQLDKSSPNRDAIRGREQQMIDANGGAQSQGGTSGNAINGISSSNPKREQYMGAAEAEFGVNPDAPAGSTGAQER